MFLLYAKASDKSTKEYCYKNGKNNWDNNGHYLSYYLRTYNNVYTIYDYI